MIPSAPACIELAHYGPDRRKGAFGRATTALCLLRYRWRWASQQRDVKMLLFSDPPLFAALAILASVLCAAPARGGDWHNIEVAGAVPSLGNRSARHGFDRKSARALRSGELRALSAAV